MVYDDLMTLLVFSKLMLPYDEITKLKKSLGQIDKITYYALRTTRNVFTIVSQLFLWFDVAELSMWVCDWTDSLDSFTSNSTNLRSQYVDDLLVGSVSTCTHTELNPIVAEHSPFQLATLFCVTNRYDT